MARTAKKERILMPEEKLAQALVLDEDGTNSIPDNWEWIKLQAISQIRTGKKDANYGTPDGQYFFFTCAAEPIRCDGYSFEGKAILLAGNGDISNISIYEGKFEAYQRTYVLNIIPSLNTEFVYYYFKYRWVDYNIDKMFGTAIPYIRLGNLQEFPIPLAPFAEQQRIVDRIESLFAKLDEAKEKAQAVVDGFEDRKAAILYKAFTGALTAEWRRVNGEPLSWDKVLFGSIILNGPQNGLYKPKTAYGQGTKILRIDGFYDGYIEPWDTLKRLTLNEEEKAVYLLQINDIVVNRVNSMPFLGKSALIRFLPEPCVFESNMMRIAIDQDKARPEYVIKYLNSSLGLAELRKNAKQAVNQASINQKDVKAVFIPLPSVGEQDEIVSLIDRLIGEETHAKEIAEQVIDQIDTMKKSILARAFRGELGTNDPSDESAVELLKRIL